MSNELPVGNQTFSYYFPDKELRQYISYYSVQHNSFSSISPIFIPDLGGSIVISLGLNDFSMVVWGPYNWSDTVWIDVALNNIEEAKERIDRVPEKNPFTIKYETKIPATEDWEASTFVLDHDEKIKQLLIGW